MTATFTEATDEILDEFKTAWDTTGWTVDYANVEQAADFAPPTEDPWARVTIQHTGGFTATLSGSAGSRRFRREGFLTVQVFVPLGEGLSEAYSLVKILADAFEGKRTPSQVWFRNARVIEVGPSAEWFQVNFLVDFEYDEVK